MSFDRTCPACEGTGGHRNACARCGGSGWLEPEPVTLRGSVAESVAEFAYALRMPTSALLEQLARAGVTKKGPNDRILDRDKNKLLKYLRSRDLESSNK